MTTPSARLSARPCLSVREWATNEGMLSPTERLILILLACRIDRHFSCAPTLRTLSAESGTSRSTVLRSLRQLEEYGLITREPKFDDDGARLPSRFFLNHPLAQRNCTARHDHTAVANRPARSLGMRVRR